MDGYIKGKPNVTWWLDQIGQGIKYRQKYAKEAQWNAWRAYYRGNWQKGILPSNIFFKMLRTIVPRVYFRNPSISITSTKPGYESMVFAKILERIDNKMIREMKVKNQIKSIVQDAFLKGTGFGKLGFGAQFTPTPDEVDTSKPEGKRDKGLVEYHARVQSGMPWFLRAPTGTIVVPDGINTLDEAPWIAQKIERPLDDVRRDPRLKHVAHLTGTRVRTTSLPQLGKMQTSQDMVEMFEIRDKRNQTVSIIAPYLSDRVLLFGDDALQMRGGLPLYDLVFNEDDEVFWGVPDAAILEPIQLELNEIRTLMMKHRRLCLVKILAKRNGITEEEAAKLVDESVSPVIFTEDDPASVVKELQASSIPRDLLVADDVMHREYRESIGFSRNEFGEFSPGSGDTTATEAQIVKMASEIRVDERRDMVADLLVDMIKDMHTVIFEQWGEEQVIDIVGPMGVPVWVEFKPQMLKTGGYDVQVDPDTALPETRQMREQKSERMYGLLKENPMIDPMKLTQYLLHNHHGTALDDMIKSMPEGVGGPQKPMNVAQFAEYSKAVQKQIGGG